MTVRCRQAGDGSEMLNSRLPYFQHIQRFLILADGVVPETTMISIGERNILSFRDEKMEC